MHPRSGQLAPEHEVDHKHTKKEVKGHEARDEVQASWSTFMILKGETWDGEPKEQHEDKV